jgi:hypothetical protein
MEPVAESHSFKEVAGPLNPPPGVWFAELE